jgi:hypothetical protein
VQWENYQKINFIGICWAFGSAQIPSATANADRHESLDNCSLKNKFQILCTHPASPRIYQYKAFETIMAVKP